MCMYPCIYAYFMYILIYHVYCTYIQIKRFVCSTCCACIHVYVCTYVHTCTHIHTYIHTQTHPCMRLCKHTHMYICTHHTYVYTHNVYTCTYIPCMYCKSFEVESFMVAKLNCSLLENIRSWMVVLHGWAYCTGYFTCTVTDRSMKTAKLPPQTICNIQYILMYVHIYVLTHT